MNSVTAPSLKSLFLPVALAALVVGPASATVHTLTATLKGVEENPTSTTLGLATCTLSLDDVALTVTVTGGYSGLLTNATTSHIHGPAGLGVIGPVMIPLLVTGGMTGTISGGGSVSAADVTNMLNGLTYLNVHTVGLPAGEVRGQILKPSPGSSTFCFGSPAPSLCPCALPDFVPAPPAGPLHGCANSFDLNGSLLKVSGSTSPDKVGFLADIGVSYAAFAFLIKGNSFGAGTPTNDGVFCVSGALVRFGAHNAGTNGAPLGMWTYPNTAQTTAVSIVTAQAPASTSAYQLFYRNAAAGFCTPAGANYSSGILIPWP